jgi:serine/threonine protein kinase/HAMP domain-containing protein
MDDSEAIDKRDGAEQSNAMLRVPILERRVAALEKVVAIERRLRELYKARAGIGELPSAPGTLPQNDDATVLTRPVAAIADDDSTVLSRPPADDSTVLYRSAALTQGTAAATPPMRADGTDLGSALVLAPGFQLFEYRIDAVLGQGGFGVTYLATDVHLNVKVAIKEYLPAGFAQRSSDKSVGPRWPEDGAVYQDGLDRFLVEARTLATFRHPNIVRVARFFEANRTAYMVLEYERGKSLKQWWPRRKRIREAELLSLLQPLLDGLAVVHGAGFLHRDIKPDNVYVRKDDGSLVLLDFGAARQAVGQAGAMADVVTPGYAPPEQYDNGAQGPWTDIYSLGATLYWMITDTKPPAAPARVSGAAQMPRAQDAGQGRFSDAFLGAVDWALETDPTARPQDLQAFSQKLFASHAGSLALRDALSADDTSPGFGNESVRALLDSPWLFKRRAQHFLRALVRPASWPMVVKMAAAMVFAALLPMLITAYYNLNGSVEAVSASELRNLMRMADSTAGRVSQLIRDNENLAKFVATEEDLIAYLKHPDNARKQEAEAKLGVLVRTNPGVQLLSLVNADGLVVISSEPGVVGMDFNSREYFRQAASGRPFQTGIIMGAIPGERGMYYASPVIDEHNEVIGVLAMRVEAATFGTILEAATRGTGRVPLMIDGDGVLIHYPDPAKLHQSLDELSASAQQRLVADQRFRKSHIDSLRMPVLARTLVGATQPGSITYMSTLSGTEDHAGYAPVPGQNWVVALTESRATFESPLQHLFSNVLHSVALVGLLFMVVAVLFARSIVRPIAYLTQAANALKDGEYERATIVVTTNDEIGRLARTFNVMIDVLRQREREKGRGRVLQRAGTGEGDGDTE